MDTTDSTDAVINPLSSQGNVPSDGEIEGHSESQARGDVAHGDQAGIGNPRGQRQEIPGHRVSSETAIAGGSRDSIIWFLDRLTD